MYMKQEENPSIEPAAEVISISISQSKSIVLFLDDSGEKWRKIIENINFLVLLDFLCRYLT